MLYCMVVHRFWDVNAPPLSLSGGDVSQAAASPVADICSRRSPELSADTSRPQSSLGSLAVHGGALPKGHLSGDQRPSSAGEVLCRRRGELTAAGVLWDRTSKDQTPKLRQCLTYAEISRNRADEICRLFGLPEEEIVEKRVLKKSDSIVGEDCASSK